MFKRNVKKEDSNLGSDEHRRGAAEERKDAKVMEESHPLIALGCSHVGFFIRGWHLSWYLLPFFVDLSQPADFSLNHTVNMYLTSEEGISLGVWHTVPESLWEDAQGKDLSWYKSSLSNGSPVFVYLHGNRKNRATPECHIEVPKLLSSLGYHVLVPDYRGFGDSTGEPTEDGLSTDAIYLYNWVKARSGNSLELVWGHSLGTGVSTNIAVKLMEKGVVVDGVVLEGTSNRARNKPFVSAFDWFYWRLRGIPYVLKDPWGENKVFFPNEKKSRSWKKTILLIFGAIVLSFLGTILPESIQEFSHMYRLRLPFFLHLSQPADFSLNHTVNMYLTSEEGISLGVWHTVPESLQKEAQGKNLSWFEKTLSNGSPVVIYLHGNKDHRAFPPHRIGVPKVLSKLGYHVLVPDFRGFGDSSGAPTQDGLCNDALYVYNWVKARSGNSLVVFWGHSLGTGVTTNVAVKLKEKGVVVDDVILEGASNKARKKRAVFTWFYWSLRGIPYLFKDPWGDNTVFFPKEDNLKKMKSPILFLHSQDDHLVHMEHVERLYAAATSAQSKDRVKLVSFDGSKGYRHNGLYRDVELPAIIKDFMQSLKIHL